MKHNNNLLDDSDYSDYSDDENKLKINEKIDNITDCKEVKVKNDNSIPLVSNLANDEFNLANDKSNINDKFIAKSDLAQPFTSTDTSPASPLIETFKKKKEELDQIYSDLSELITRNEDEYNALIQRLENEIKILKQQIEDEKEKSENFNLEILKLREGNQKMTKEINTMLGVNLQLISQKDSLVEEIKNLKQKNLDLTRHGESQVSNNVSIVNAYYQNQFKDLFHSMVTDLNKKKETVPISTNESHQNKNKSYVNRVQSNSYVPRGDSSRFNNSNNNNNNQRHKLNNYNNYNYNNKSEKENTKNCGNRWEPRSPSYSKSRSRSR
jgi:hypothetical protein